MRARDEISAAVPDADVRVEVCDVSDLAGVRAFAADLSGRLSRLDVLVHDAGVLLATVGGDRCRAAIYIPKI